MKSPSSTSQFKKCTSCAAVWLTRDAFLSDPEIELTGYMANFDKVKLGLLLFLHKKEGCLTTVAIKAGEVRDLYRGPVYKENLSGTDVCPGYCLRKTALVKCPKKCECAWVTEVMDIIKNWKKNRPA